MEEQAAGTSGANVGSPSIMVSHWRSSTGGFTRGHQPLLPSSTRQPSALLHGNPLPTVPAALASPDRQAPATDAQPQQPGLPQSAPAYQARGQHPVSSRHHWPLAYLQHRSLLPSKRRYSTVSMWISLSCWHMISNTSTLAWTTARP